MQSTMQSLRRGCVRSSALGRLHRLSQPSSRSFSLSGESFLSGTSAVYVEEMYAAYKKSPARCVGEPQSLPQWSCGGLWSVPRGTAARAPRAPPLSSRARQ